MTDHEQLLEDIAILESSIVEGKAFVDRFLTVLPDQSRQMNDSLLPKWEADLIRCKKVLAKKTH